MPRSHLEHYPFDVDELLGRFNALFGGWNEWRPTSARKEHQDLFGEVICDGEIYYKRQMGPAWDDVIKLSRLSMERLLYAVFYGNSRLENIAARIEQAEQSRLQEEHDLCSPLTDLPSNPKE
jgi:hypothetical protein